VGGDRRVLVEVLRRAPLPGGRLRLDRLRLPRRADAVWLAVHQLALRHPGHVRFSEGQLLLLPGVVGFETRAAPVSALELERKEGQEIEVWCHTNLEQVELFLNGQSLGAQKVVKNTHVAWKVKYAPGVIEARGSKGQQALTAKCETTGPAARIVLRPDRARIAAMAKMSPW